MPKSISKVLMAIAALGALALGGSALADAASNNSSGSTGNSQNAADPYGAPYGAPPARPNGQNGRRPPGGRHRGANGQQEKALTGDTAAKVKEAALAKVSGGTVERVETDADHGSPYEAHVRKSDGTEVEVLVNKDFKVTAVNDMQHP
jgi:hypothetical protein